MPKCKSCQKEFPLFADIDGKKCNLQRRVYCLECNPVGARKFWGGKEIDKSKRSEKRKYICPICNREHFSKTRNKQCVSCKSREKRSRIRTEIKDLFGGKCSICGYDKCERSLVFHHIDPTKKDFSISCFWNLAKDTIIKEAKKCVLLCCRCHDEVHAGITKL